MGQINNQINMGQSNMKQLNMDQIWINLTWLLISWKANSSSVPLTDATIEEMFWFV